MAANGERVHRTAEQWRELVAEQASSGLGVNAFCRERGLAASSLRNWKRKLESSPGSSKGPVDFVELTSPASAPGESRWDVELDLGTGMVLRLRRR